MKKLSVILLTTIFCLSAFAQQKSLDEITSFRIKNSGSFMDKNNDVDGYYFYYEVDKLKKGKREYAIKMLDNNLNDIATKSYIDDKNTILAQSKFNNQALMFAMINIKEKFYKLVTFDKSGNQGKDIKIDVSKKDVRWLSMMMKSGNFNLLFPVDDNGFLFNYTKNNKKMGYGLKYVSTNGGESWDYNSPEDANQLMFLNPIEANEKVVVAIESSKKSALSNTVNMKIVVLDINTGKKLFEKDYNRDDNPRLITNAFLTEEKNLVLLGEYFKKGKNIVKDKSEGLFAQVVDMSGNLISDVKADWENTINKLMPADSNGKKKKSTYVYFHDVIRTQNGSYYAIGEKYRKTVSLKGTLLTGRIGSGMTQLTITDAVFFEFDKSFNLKEIHKIEKGKSRAPNLADFGSPQLNAHALKTFGAFDYEYTQIDKDRDRFYAMFIDYERLKGEKNKLAFKAVMYNDGELSQDKIYLEQSKGRVSFRVLPAKLGHVMIVEYNKKEKTLDIHLEKLNI
ncbi:DUF6770 family protein [uncultured Winogradskyella sp.]|uniref:DUF6770 family protein n=1 Tax=uncultured Winogradskyella sp. TaxID=395353 RepID=UPI00260985BE|nr:DUF6770 family protein [uncultured Winogradskyella sp.]